MTGPMPAAHGSVAVVGGSSQIRKFLLPRLTASGERVTVFTRGDPGPDPDVRWHARYAGTPGDALVKQGPFDALIWLAPLPTLPDALAAAGTAGIRRVIAFGTTARFYKGDSGSAAERRLAADMSAAEAELRRVAAGSGIAWTLFRPTLVYGCGMDENVAFIARMIRRWKFFPLVDGGRGLRQPVHADDLAGACLSVLRNPETFGRAYDLSGGQTLSYRAMVLEVFAGLGMTPRLVPVPGWLLKRLVSSVRFLPRFRSLSPDMVDRISMDLCFSHEDAHRDFGYAPRPFRLDASALTQNDSGIDPAGPA